MGYQDSQVSGTQEQLQEKRVSRRLTAQEKVALMHQSVPRERNPNARYMFTTDQPQGVAIDELIRKSL